MNWERTGKLTRKKEYLEEMVLNFNNYAQNEGGDALGHPWCIK